MGSSYHIIGYFENPSLNNGKLTTQEYLNTFLDSFSENVTILSDEVQLTEVEKETNIQNNGFPGRD
jgi:hypothetical protein